MPEWYEHHYDYYLHGKSWENDSIVGSTYDDYIDGNAGDDTLWGGFGDDVLFGGDGHDDLHGHGGRDTLIGGEGTDWYFLHPTLGTGDLHAGQADLISGLSEDETIWVAGDYAYAGTATDTPGDGQYSVWQSGDEYVITFNSATTDTWHDVIVRGADPSGNIAFQS